MTCDGCHGHTKSGGAVRRGAAVKKKKNQTRQEIKLLRIGVCIVVSKQGSHAAQLQEPRLSGGERLHSSSTGGGGEGSRVINHD